MNDREEKISRNAHLDPEAFRAAVERTAHDFNFRPALVEKDYFCSILLESLFLPEAGWVFKGGTCLSKIYADFYRLSEDLDFCISVQDKAKRAARRRLIDPAKRAVDALPKRVRGVEIADGLSGRNESTQYVAVVRYRSIITGDWEKVKIEIAMREPLFRPAVVRHARTLARNAFTGKELMPPFPVRAIDLTEALAEKVRAALTRRDAAVRDFFDLHYALEHLKLRPDDPVFVKLIRQKLAVPGNDSIQLTAERRNALEKQRQMELSVVLRAGDFEAFDLDRVWEALTALVKRLNV